MAIATVTLNPAVDISTNAPEVQHTIKIRCEHPLVEAGGGGVNVARVAQRFGAPVETVVCAGGPSGDRLITLLEREGLSCRRIPLSGETRESFTVTDGHSHEQYRFVMPGPVMTDAEAQEALKTVASIEPMPEMVVLSGSFPPGLPATFSSDLAQTAKAAGAQLIVDGPAPVLAATEGAFLIKPNTRELSMLVGRALGPTGEVVAAAREVIARGTAQNVLVSMGEDGAVLVTDGAASLIEVPTIELVSAVGAGDSMVGALAAALVSGKSLLDAAVLGSSAGAAAVMTPGTDLCRVEDARHIESQINVEPVLGAA